MAKVSSSNENFALRKEHNSQEFKKNILAFALSIFLTIIAFIAVATDVISDEFTAPFIVVLAVVQVIFQLYYFMHMKHKGHESANLFMWSGIACAAVFLAGIVLVSWV